MKFIIKSSIIIMFLLGFYLCISFNFFSESLYSLTFYRENALSHIYNILLQNKELHNTKEVGDSLHEYYISILKPVNISSDLSHLITSSSFNILNLNGKYIENLGDILPYTKESNTLLINGDKDSLSKDTYRFYKYSDYSISYMNPSLKTHKERYNLHRCLSLAEDNSYVSPIFINKEDLNESFMHSLITPKRLFIILGDEIKVVEENKCPIIYLNTQDFEDNKYIYQINLMLSNSKIKKVRLKVYPITNEGNPIYGEEVFKILNKINNNSKIKFQIHENDDYILNEYDILKDS